MVKIGYSLIRPLLETGDIVLFSGKSWLSGLIRFLTSGKISHVGIVVRDEFTSQVLILESYVSKAANGVQLSPLGLRIKEYRGEVYVRQLRTERTEKMTRQLQKWIKDFRGTSYEQGVGGFIEMLASTFDFWPFNNKTNEAHFFCSELVATIYLMWGLLGQGPANEYTPRDFCFGQAVDRLLLFSSEPACLREPRRVK